MTNWQQNLIDAVRRRIEFTSPEGKSYRLNPEIAVLLAALLLEVEGAAHYLPAYAWNLDIMTSAALRTAERMATHQEDLR